MSDARAQLDALPEFVGQRLAAHPGAFRVPAVNLEIYVIRDFLTQAECDGLIQRIDVNRIPSYVLGHHPDPEFRTSESCNLQPADPLVRQIETKIAQLTGIPMNYGETIQGQRYAVGQQFKAHHDWFRTDQPYWQEQKTMGGQRTWTVMAFLNKPEAGGQTYFPKAGVRITPKAGNLLAWNNLTPGGVPNDFTLHQGCPVEAGVKYVITKWHRERPWVSGGSGAY